MLVLLIDSSDPWIVYLSIYLDTFKFFSLAFLVFNIEILYMFCFNFLTFDKACIVSLNYNLSWRMLPVCLRRMFILLPGWIVPYMSVRSIWKSLIQTQCFGIDFLSGWSIHCWKQDIEVPYYYCIVAIFPFRAVKMCLIYLDAPALGGYIFTIAISFLVNWPFYHYIMILFLSCSLLWLKVYFVCYKYRYPFFLLPFAFHLHKIYFSILSLWACVCS